jgi:Zn-dependent protease
MLRAWKIGRLFGIRVYVHWSCLLLVALALGSGLSETSLPRAVVGAMLVPALLGCVLLHECGHALAARFYGIPTRDITLYPIGGVARLESIGQRPIEELVIAVAGPAVNVLIALLLTLAFLPFGMSRIPSALESDTPANLLGFFIFMLLLGNLVLAVFNLIPAFPMDGGRVLRSLLRLGLGRLRATQIAAHVGLGLALGIAVLGPVAWYFFFGQINFMPVLVGLFVAYAGQRELRAVRRVEAEQAREQEEGTEEALSPAASDEVPAPP